MATVIQDNINLFPDQKQYIDAEVNAGRMDKQKFYRICIEAGIQARKQEAKIENLQPKGK